MVESVNSGNSTSGNEGNTELSAKDKQLKAAIVSVNKGLDNLSPDDLHKLYDILKLHNNEAGDAGAAFAKLDVFVQKKLDNFSDGKENIAREDFADLQKLENEVRTVHKPETGKPLKTVANRIKTENDKFDKDNSLASVAPGAAAQIAANMQTIDAAMREVLPLARKEDGTPQNPTLENFAEFFKHMDLVPTEDGAQNKQDLMNDMLELAILEAQTDLALDPNFSKLSSSARNKRLIETIGARADAKALEIIKAQMLADFRAENADLLARGDNMTPEEKKLFEEKIKDFNARVARETQGYVGRAYPNTNFKVSGNVGTAVVVVGSRNLVDKTSRIEEKTGFAGLKQRAKAFDARMKKEHPKIYSATQKAMVSGVVGLLSGGAGLAVLSAYRSYQLVESSYKTFKESNAEGSYLKYLKDNPKELLGIVSSVTLTAVSASFGLSDLHDNGLQALGGIGKIVGRVVDSNTMMAQATDKVARAVTRASISVSSGLTNAGMDFRAAWNEKDKERRKQLYKNAFITAGISIVAGGVGIASAEYGDKAFGWLKERFGTHVTPAVSADDKVDGITGAAIKVKNDPSLSTQNILKMDSKELDDKLYKLGMKPSEYENMSAFEKANLLDHRVKELGDLAKDYNKPENSSKAPSTLAAENGVLTEKQLQHMVKLSADRHPGVDMNKIYTQLKSAGVKNPEEAFYKLEQSRLLAPNDKIMTENGTNIRETLNRALKGEKLTVADMAIIGRAQDNVDNTGHYLNDVRAQGGSGYSYRPRGVEQSNANTVYQQEGSAKSGTKADNVVTQANQEQENADKNKQNVQNPDNQGNKDRENNPYKINAGDSKYLISAKQEAARAEAEYRAAMLRVKTTGTGVSATRNLPINDPKRIEAEFKHAEAMKDEVKKQMVFSKKEISLARAECDQLGDNIEARKVMEARMTELRQDLKRYGLGETDIAKVTGEYGGDKHEVSKYFKEALKNKKNYVPTMKLLKERDDLLKQMQGQGPRPVMEQQYAEAQQRVELLNKKEFYRDNEQKEPERLSEIIKGRSTNQAVETNVHNSKDNSDKTATGNSVQNTVNQRR